MKKQLGALVLASSIALTGCFGSFALTKKAYDFNKGMGDKWIQWVVFLVATGVGATPIIVAVDLLVLNSIEFWTGSNPVATGDTFHQRDEQGNQVVAVKMPDGSLFMQIQTHDGQKQEMILQSDDEILRILDAHGKLKSEHAFAQ